MKVVEAVRRFVKKEDPIVWKSLIIADILTLAFFVFVLIYTKYFFK